MERFWDKVDRKGPDECWPWTASTSGGGYGTFWLGGRQWSSNRVAFLLHHGHEPAHNALHTCDFKLCCNPAHLYDGTKKQNAEDAVARGQHPEGTRHGRAKLCDEDVLAMRTAHATGKSFAALGRQYGVSDSVARKACLGITWDHL